MELCDMVAAYVTMSTNDQPDHVQVDSVHILSLLKPKFHLITS